MTSTPSSRAPCSTYAIVAVLSLGLLTVIAARQSGRLLAPLRTVRETASDITASDLSQRLPERGNDDVTALTRTFNDMLDRLEEGVEAQRRFLDDAGHELQDAAHGAARPPRAARRAATPTRSSAPASCSSTRSTA